MLLERKPINFTTKMTFLRKAKKGEKKEENITVNHTIESDVLLKELINF